MKGYIETLGKNRHRVWVSVGKDIITGKRLRLSKIVIGSKGEAEDTLDEMKAEVKKGSYNTSYTVTEWMNYWLEKVVYPNKAIKTYENFESKSRLYIVPVLKNMKLSNLKGEDVDSLMNYVEEQSSSNTANYTRSVLGTALESAKKRKHVSRNVVFEDTDVRTVLKKPLQIPAASEVNAVLDYASTNYPEFFPIYRLLAYTGMRLGEALALTWSDIDLDNKKVSITKSISKTRWGLMLGKPKTGNSNRTLGIDQRTVDILRNVRGAQVLQRDNNQGAYADKNLIFANALGEYITPNQVWIRLQTIANHLGFSAFKTHAFRHFHVSMLLKSDQNIYAIMRRLGHKSIQVTMDIYGHLIDNTDDTGDVFAKQMEDARR